ncbi:beta-2-microglobulin [Lissotriton helveticus]
MARIMLFALLLGLGCWCQATIHPPKVNMYTTGPLEEGKENTGVCLVRGFHPPDIKVAVLKNGEEIKNTQGTDMSFDNDWKYQWMKYFTFTYTSGDEYECRVAHGQSEPKVYKWDPML